MDIAIVGAGLSGLAAGIELAKLGHSVEIYEASDGPGGRVRSDLVDGRFLDRGFQILLTAYPEAQALLDYDALDLRSFQSGALIRVDDDFHRVIDPIRHPSQLLSTLRVPIGSLFDKLRILSYRRRVLRGDVEDLWNGSETTALQRFQQLGFSPSIIDRFLRPLFTGITLDADLGGSSHVVDFVFRMLATGDAAVPARGMGQIPAQMATNLPEGTVKINHQVEQVGPTQLIVNGEAVRADAVLVATDISSASALCDEVAIQGWKSVTSVWMTSAAPPTLEPVLVLNSGGSDPINSMAVMSRVSPFYGSGGLATVVASSPSVRPGLVDDMKAELIKWYGKKAARWEVIRVDEIKKAQPMGTSPAGRAGVQKLQNGVWVCGDHTVDASINGALRSGRLAAQAIHRSTP